MKYSHPSIKDAIKAAKSDSISRLVCIPVAPFYSYIGTGSYFENVKSASEDTGFNAEIVFVKSWYKEKALERAWVKMVSELKIDNGWVMLFTAHSLPQTKFDDLSVYRWQLIYTANAVQSHFGCKWSLGFQSAADVPGRWIGPDAAWQIRELAKNKVKRLAIIPIGFVADNLETMYDIGIEYAKLCTELGIEAKISRMPNDSQYLVQALYNAYIKAINEIP